MQFSLQYYMLNESKWERKPFQVQIFKKQIFFLDFVSTSTGIICHEHTICNVTIEVMLCLLELEILNSRTMSEA
jgi:hypothetical protein